MTWVEDLSPCTYLRFSPEAKLVAVGWLHPGHPFSEGEVPRAITKKIFTFVASPLDPRMFRGIHDCEFCGASGMGGVSFEGVEARLGALNLYVPSPKEDLIYVAPSLVGHYILEHGYLPPERFLAAVSASPEPGTLQHALALFAHGSGAPDWERSLTSRLSLGLRLGEHRLEGAQALTPYLLRVLVREMEVVRNPLATRIDLWTTGLKFAADCLAATRLPVPEALPLLEEAVEVLSQRERLSPLCDRLRDAMASIRLASRA